MNELIKAEQFGLDEKQATEITKGLGTILAERAELEKSYEDVISLEITEENISTFKDLRLKIVKNRTQGIMNWHKANKDFYLRGGQFVDAIKRKEIAVNESMESKLMDAEKYFENLEKERLVKVQNDRAERLSEYVEDAHERDLVKFEEDEFESLLQMKKKEHEDRIEAEKKAEAERIAKEKEEEAERLRIRKENEELKRQAEERERLAKIESDKRAKEEAERLAKEAKELKEREAEQARLKSEHEAVLKAEREKKQKLEDELKAKQEAEQKAKEAEEKRVQLELKKGDSEKIKDLINDLSALKTKYSFSSKDNLKVYKDVSVLIDKVIEHINKAQ